MLKFFPDTFHTFAATYV